MVMKVGRRKLKNSEEGEDGEILCLVWVGRPLEEQANDVAAVARTRKKWTMILIKEKPSYFVILCLMDKIIYKGVDFHSCYHYTHYILGVAASMNTFLATFALPMTKKNVSRKFAINPGPTSKYPNIAALAVILVVGSHRLFSYSFNTDFRSVTSLL